MSFKDQFIICSCILGFHFSMLGATVSLWWVAIAFVFLHAGLCFIDAKVKK